MLVSILFSEIHKNINCLIPEFPKKDFENLKYNHALHTSYYWILLYGPRTNLTQYSTNNSCQMTYIKAFSSLGDFFTFFYKILQIINLRERRNFVAYFNVFKSWRWHHYLYRAMFCILLSNNDTAIRRAQILKYPVKVYNTSIEALTIHFWVRRISGFFTLHGRYFVEACLCMVELQG